MHATAAVRHRQTDRLSAIPFSFTHCNVVASSPQWRIQWKTNPAVSIYPTKSNRLHFSPDPSIYQPKHVMPTHIFLINQLISVIAWSTRSSPNSIGCCCSVSRRSWENSIVDCFSLGVLQIISFLFFISFRWVRLDVPFGTSLAW